jgi:N-methylhydantoinase A
MTGAIKEISVMRGHDPRAFVLFAYGGAGPMYAAFIAEELGMKRVVVPPLPGNFSAFGLLVADVRHDYVRSRLVATRDVRFDDVTAALRELSENARRRLRDEGFAESAMRFEAGLDMRYIGQAFELSVPFLDSFTSMADVDAAFYAAHERRYSHAVADPIEIVSFRLSAYGLLPKPTLPKPAPATSSLADARTGERSVVFDGASVATPIYRRDRLPQGGVVIGPAVIEEAGATTVVPPAWRVTTDEQANMLIEQ